jgi:predicted MFS family arabinose efflux permease
MAQAGTAFIFLGIGALAGFIQEAYDLNGTQTGLIVTAIGLAAVAALLPTGRLLDRGSERLIITGSALLLAIGTALAARADSYASVLLLLFVAGTGYSASQPGGSKVIASWFPTQQRGLAMGIRQTGLPLGGALAAAVLPAMANRSGWEAAMLTGAVVAAASGALFGLVYRRPPITLPAADGRVGPELRGLLKTPAIRLAMQSGLGMVAIQFALLSYLMLYLRDIHNIPLARGAWMLFAAQMTGSVGRVTLAAWSDRLPDRLIPVWIAAAAAALGTGVLAMVQSEWSFVPLLILSAILGFFAFGWYGPWVVFVAESAPEGAMGLTLALAMTSNQLAIVAAPPIFGLLYDLSGGYMLPWSTMAVILVAVAWRTATGRHRTRL